MGESRKSKCLLTPRRLMHVGFHCVKHSTSSVRRQLSQTMTPVFCDDGVFHTVADILSQTHLQRTPRVCLDGFTMRTFNYVLLVAASGARPHLHFP